MDRKDLDETRRLLLMTLAAPHTKRYNLAGTLMNALLYHQNADEEREGLLSRVIAAVEGTGDAGWIWSQVDAITAQLERPESDS
jgi:cytochrome c-type biogenesis protein CcmH/NrfG